MGVNLLKVSLIRTRTMHSSGTFYSLADFGNDALSLGFGYSLGGWIGADYYYTSSGSFGFSSQISPWFSLGAELGLKDGLTIKAGVINEMTSNELAINVSTPMLGAFAVCGVIAAIPVPGARIVAGIGAVATSIFVLFTNI